MHEWGIVDSVIEEVIKQGMQNKMTKGEKVCLSLGEDENLTLKTLEFCFLLSNGTIVETTKV